MDESNLSNARQTFITNIISVEASAAKATLLLRESGINTKQHCTCVSFEELASVRAIGFLTSVVFEVAFR